MNPRKLKEVASFTPELLFRLEVVLGERSKPKLSSFMFVIWWFHRGFWYEAFPLGQGRRRSLDGNIKRMLCCGLTRCSLFHCWKFSKCMPEIRMKFLSKYSQPQNAHFCGSSWEWGHKQNCLLLLCHSWIGIQKDIKFVQETASVKSSVYTDNFRLETATKKEKLEYLGWFNRE